MLKGSGIEAVVLVYTTSPPTILSVEPTPSASGLPTSIFTPARLFIASGPSKLRSAINIASVSSFNHCSTARSGLPTR